MNERFNVSGEDLHEAEHHIGMTEREELLTFRYAYYECIDAMKEAIEVIGDDLEVAKRMQEVIDKCPL